MFAFLAKIGRTSWAKAVMPASMAVVPFGYLYIHTWGHQFVRNQLVARDSHGEPLEVSDNLKTLIMNVWSDVRSHYNKPLVETKFEFDPTPMKWFISGGVDAATFGMSESKHGVLIGLPITIDFNNPEDVPDSLLEFKKLRLFRKTLIPEERQDKNIDGDLIPPWKLKKDRKDGKQKEFIDSLFLSENARKFLVARELFFSDSYRILGVAMVLSLSIGISVLLSRLAVNKTNLIESHIRNRLLVYMITGTFGFCTYTTIADNVHRAYTTNADKRAIALNESYRQGAIDYFCKLRARNVAMRNLFDDAKDLFSTDGEVIEPFIRSKHVPISERLKLAQEYEFEKVEDPNPKDK